MIFSFIFLFYIKFIFEIYIILKIFQMVNFQGSVKNVNYSFLMLSYCNLTILLFSKFKEAQKSCDIVFYELYFLNGPIIIFFSSNYSFLIYISGHSKLDVYGRSNFPRNVQRKSFIFLKFIPYGFWIMT